MESQPWLTMSDYGIPALVNYEPDDTFVLLTIMFYSEDFCFILYIHLTFTSSNCHFA